MNLIMNPVPNERNTEYGYWMPTIILDKKLNINREKLQKICRKQYRWKSIFYPLSSLPMFKEKKKI